MITFDSSPAVYWLLAYLLAALTLVAGSRKSIPTWLYLTSALLLLVVMRLPSVVLNREINADESQVLAHAITLFTDPVYWHSVDALTIGPLDVYPLVLPNFFGFQADYVSARITGLVFEAGALLAFFAAIRLWFGGSAARIATLLPLIFLAFTQETDFVHYSSEKLPLFLMGICLALLASLSVHEKAFSLQAFLLGFVAGMVPYAKLQAVPQAGILVVAGLYVAYRYYQRSGRTAPLWMLLLGGVTFPLLALAGVAYHGVTQDFVGFYILGNAVYASGGGLGDAPARFGQIVGLSPDFTALLVVVAIVVALGLLVGRRPLIRNEPFEGLFMSLFVLGYGLAAVYSVVKSGNLFVHYLNFCVYPLSLAAALGVHRLARVQWASLLGPVLLLGWFGAQDARTFFESRRLNELASEGRTDLARNPAVETIASYSTPNDRLVVWGWADRYYVETQLGQGTAESHSERSIYLHPLQDKYRERYMRDIRRTRPVVFMDAVGKNSLWVQDVATQGYEAFPELARYIDKNYKYLGKIDDTRLFVRNDRVIEIMNDE